MGIEGGVKLVAGLMVAGLIGYWVGVDVVGEGRVREAVDEAGETAGLVYLGGVCAGARDMAERWSEVDTFLDLSPDQLVNQKMEAAAAGWDLGAIEVPPFEGAPEPPHFLNDLREVRMAEARQGGGWGWRNLCAQGTRP